MKNKKWIFLGFFIVLSAWIILGTFSGKADNGQIIPRETGVINEGKNTITIEYPMYASELILLNPEVEYVSYHDDFLNRQISYVNVFGGVGQNFLMMPEKEYEIYSGISINLKTR